MDIKNKTTIEFNNAASVLNGAGEPPAGPLLNSQSQFQGPLGWPKIHKNGVDAKSESVKKSG